MNCGFRNSRHQCHKLLLIRFSKLAFMLLKEQRPLVKWGKTGQFIEGVMEINEGIMTDSRDMTSWQNVMWFQHFITCHILPVCTCSHTSLVSPSESYIFRGTKIYKDTNFL